MKFSVSTMVTLARSLGASDLCTAHQKLVSSDGVMCVHSTYDLQYLCHNFELCNIMTKLKSRANVTGISWLIYI